MSFTVHLRTVKQCLVINFENSTQQPQYPSLKASVRRSGVPEIPYSLPVQPTAFAVDWAKLIEFLVSMALAGSFQR